MRLYVNNDHTDYSIIRRSGNMFSCLLAACIDSQILMTQTTFETSFLGGDFMAMKTTIEHIKGLRFKLWMMGVPFNGPDLLLYCEEWVEIL